MSLVPSQGSQGPTPQGQRFGSLKGSHDYQAIEQILTEAERAARAGQSVAFARILGEPGNLQHFNSELKAGLGWGAGGLEKLAEGGGTNGVDPLGNATNKLTKAASYLGDGGADIRVAIEALQGCLNYPPKELDPEQQKAKAIESCSKFLEGLAKLKSAFEAAVNPTHAAEVAIVAASLVAAPSTPESDDIRLAATSYSAYQRAAIEAGQEVMTQADYAKARAEVISTIADPAVLAEVVRRIDVPAERPWPAIELYKHLFSKLAEAGAEATIIDLMQLNKLTAYWGGMFLSRNTLFEHLKMGEPHIETARGLYGYTVVRKEGDIPEQAPLQKKDLSSLALEADSPIVRFEALKALYLTDQREFLLALVKLSQPEQSERRRAMGTWHDLTQLASGSELLGWILRWPAVTLPLAARILPAVMLGRLRAALSWER